MDLEMLNWRHHQQHATQTIANLLHFNQFCDVTLMCHGKECLPAHRFILCAWSDYFASMLPLIAATKETVIVLKDCQYDDVKLIVEFMYNGEISVNRNQIETLRRVAQSLQVQSLIDILASMDDTTALDDRLSDNNEWKSNIAVKPLTDALLTPMKPLKKRKNTKLSTEKPSIVPIIASDGNWIDNASDPLESSPLAAPQKVKIECQAMAYAMDDIDTDYQDDNHDEYTANDNDDGDDYYLISEGDAAAKNDVKSRSGTKKSADKPEERTSKVSRRAQLADASPSLEIGKPLMSLAPGASNRPPCRICCTHFKRRRKTRFFCLRCNVPICLEHSIALHECHKCHQETD